MCKYIARVTKNKVSDIVKMIGKAESDRQFYLAIGKDCVRIRL
ncbi:hypothetical protein [Clostridium gasigenes]|nr:hypothetical protein [Clostridium gasigenes]